MNLQRAIEIIPTIVPKTFSDVQNVSEQYSSFTSFFQIDVADGKFAPNTTWLPEDGYMLPREFGYEVHMMVQEPRALGIHFARAGAARIIGHVEAFDNSDSARGALDAWKEAGAREVGLAILFHTPLATLEPLIPALDVVLMMSIATIGRQGISYEPRASERIKEFRDKHPDTLIAVDGGVSAANIEELMRAGARRFGVGSAISRAEDPAASYRDLKKLAESAVV